MSQGWQTLVSADELNAALVSGHGIVLFDCRHSLTEPDAGQLAWSDSHLPGAYFAPLDNVLSGAVVAGVSGRHPLPAREDFANWLAQRGVETGVQVVVYDDMGGAFAARLWWMLRWLGHHQVAVLDGGVQAWLAAGHEMNNEVPSLQNSNFRASESEFVAVTVEQVQAAQGTDSLCLLDARSGERYRGESEPFAPVAGHIPGAYSAPFPENLQDGLFKEVGVLKERFEGVWQRDGVVCYCGSGVTGCHNILAMVHAGIEKVPALYTGSWSEWIQDASRPVAVGTKP